MNEPFHWHVHVWPKATTLAGFEMGTGVADQHRQPRAGGRAAPGGRVGRLTAGPGPTRLSPSRDAATSVSRSRSRVLGRPTAVARRRRLQLLKG